MVPPYFCIGKRFLKKTVLIIIIYLNYIVQHPNYSINAPHLQAYATFSTGFEACFFSRFYANKAKKLRVNQNVIVVAMKSSKWCKQNYIG